MRNGLSPDPDLGSRIRARRKELRLTQRELARRAGCSFTFLCDVENGKRRIGADLLLAVGRALGLSLDTLMAGSGEPNRPGCPVPAMPASLLTFAAAGDTPFRHALALHAIARVILHYRTNAAKGALDGFDWPRLYGAVREWL